ncbi:hypothetical protein TOT_040000009 [Theileria orientalis strain Shintoku]|uniref:Uncharacterized protein n=1 Tax=Theileria orientalis strain Shintoku TaxID=869250 RepID=J4C8Z1_THEOR|nr:hypothetical protein TOT_040000009 [Theileria orientalis strain Shintoku]BAM41628.1 hypothetical protein TOT_040000009 [Theileria orientalis strain Shintoku]|eukprot:XP_009691929.1 hypothetical protein TOT_040000009 [Theileria orientalis strain Shintoku]
MPTIHMGTTVNTLSQSMCEWPPPYIYTVEKTLNKNQKMMIQIQYTG